VPTAPRHDGSAGCQIASEIRPPPARRSGSTRNGQEAIMGKYFLAWILGVPAVVLVIIYLLFS